MHKVFIDGQNGTTGLQIHERLRRRDDIELLIIDEAQRKNPQAKKNLIEAADVLILCLPDEAAIEAAALAGDCVVIDASTAHRTHPDWVYGLPELPGAQRDQIRTSKRIANPGCYPTGVVLALRPLVETGVIASNAGLFVSALSGYSGGGKCMIEDFTRVDQSACRPYALSLDHKHRPEMQVYSGLTEAPVFLPHVGNFYQGMLIEIGIKKRAFGRQVTGQAVIDAWHQHYQDESFIRIMALNPSTALDGKFLDPEAVNGTNLVDLMCFESEQDLLLVARLDNLGKGAAGAAVQNLNIALNIEESVSLIQSEPSITAP